MKQNEIKTCITFDGGELYRTEIRTTCKELELLREHVEAVNKSVTQLNSSLRELSELRKAAI